MSLTKTQHVLFIVLHYTYVKVSSRLEVLYKTHFKHHRLENNIWSALLVSRQRAPSSDTIKIFYVCRNFISDACCASYIRSDYYPRRSRRDIVLASSVRPSVHSVRPSGTISQYLLVRFDSFLVQMISTMDSQTSYKFGQNQPLNTWVIALVLV